MQQKLFIGISIALVVALGFVIIDAGNKSSNVSEMPLDTQMENEVAQEHKVRRMDILQYVPADTYFFFGGLEPTPLFSWLQGVITDDDINQLIATAHKNAVESDGLDEQLESQTPEVEGDPSSLLKFFFGAALEYIRVEKDPQLVAKTLGITTQLESALYTIDSIPVFRMKLSDVDAFHAFVASAEKTGQVEAGKEEINGVEYKTYSFAELVTDTLWEHYKVFLTVHDNYALSFVATTQELEEKGNLILGVDKPQQSIDQTTILKDLVANYKYDPGVLGYVDELAIIDTLLNPEQSLNPMLYSYAYLGTFTGSIVFELISFDLLLDSEVAEVGDYAQSVLNKLRTPECHKDVVAIANVFPRTVQGYTELAHKAMPMRFSYSMVTEVSDKELLQDFKNLRGYAPNAFRQVKSDMMFGLGLGFDAGALVPFLTKSIQSLVNAEFSCQPLVASQAVLKNFSGQVLMGAAAVSGVVNGVKGLSMGVYDIKIAQNSETGDVDLQQLDALIALSADNPATLLMMASSMHPAISEINLPSDGSVVDFPMPLPWPEVGTLKMAMKGQHIFIFVGSKAAEKVTELAGESLEKNTVMSMNLDSKPLFSLLFQLLESDSEMQEEVLSEEDELAKRLLEKVKRLSFLMNYQYDVSDVGLSATANLEYRVEADSK